MFYLKCSVIILVLLPLQFVSSVSTEFPTVKTEAGVLKGKHLKSRDGCEYAAFVGIRYGVVPGRFKNSVPSPAWEGHKDATEFGSPCIQPSFNPGVVGPLGAEDCLFLNVYTPKVDNKKRPVLVFIHGGGFLIGSGDAYGAKYFMDEEIVVVTINYRLGIFGFLDTQDGVVPGNMGLKDQVLALRWIQDNIEAFGGNPSQVTLSGGSSGGVSALLLLMSPLTKGLFHQVISESGSPTNPWSYQKNPLPKAVMVGEKLECDTRSSTNLVECLRKKSLSEISVAERSFATFYIDPMAHFMPTTEVKNELNPDPLVRNPPAESLKAGFHAIPVLMTVNREEGSMFHAAGILRNPPVLKQLNEEWDRVAPITFWYENDAELQSHQKEVSKKLYKFYFGDDEITLKKEVNLTNLYTDSWFLTGIHDAALQLAKQTNVYVGLVTHQRKDWSALSTFGIFENLGITTHCDEISYLYNMANPNATVPAFVSPNDIVDQDDVDFSKAFVKTIVSFASTGTPKVMVGKKPKWNSVSEKEIESGDLNFLNIGLDPYVYVKPFQERIGFWKKLHKSNGSVKEELIL